MGEQLFNIVFAGELLEGHEQAAVQTRLAALFKSDEQRIAVLFDGRRHVVKRDTNADTANRYVRAMAKAGAVAQADPIAQSPAAETPPPPAAAPSPPVAAVPPAEASTADLATGVAAGEFDLAPVGSAMIDEDELHRPEPVQVSIEHLAVASIFAAETVDAPPPPPPPDTSHIGVSEAGVDLNPDRVETPPPPPPDTSAISLAETGSRMSDEVDTVPVSVPDVSSITLAPPGEPLDELHPQKTPVNPDISGLSLAPEGDG